MRIGTTGGAKKITMYPRLNFIIKVHNLFFGLLVSHTNVIHNFGSR